MADIKNALSKQVTRGEVLAQIVVILITVLGVVQFTHILAAQPDKKDSSNVSSVGATGAPGQDGIPGVDGAAGKDGKPGTKGLTGALGATGAAGAKGSKGAKGTTGIPGILSSAYGQLSGTSQDIEINDGDTWVPLPFDTAGPSSDMDVSISSPATITVQSSGVCQTNVNIYFSAEDSNEGSFIPTTYSLGVKINNGTTQAVTAVQAEGPGEYVLNFSNITDLNASDTVQFYISASDAEFGDFANVVTLENGNAYLMQISD